MKKNLLKSALLALMVLVGGSAWAGDKTVVKYSFDDATSPSLTAGSRVGLDYSRTSVISSTTFLNAWNNTNGDPGASTVSLGNTDLSGETWTLSFEWAACGGCNSKADHTTLKAGDTNLFDLTGNSNWNTTVTITYAGSDGTKTLPVPGCDKGKRFTAAVGDQLNTATYWHHIVVTGSASGVTMTITNSSTGTAVVENVMLSETNVNPTSLIIEPCCGGAIGIDDLSLTYSVEGEVIQTPTANYSAVNGIERTIAATCDTEGATLYYSTDGENWTEGSSITVSASGNVYFKAVKGNSESDVLTFEAVAGEAITLNAPTIVRSDNTTVTISADQTNLLLSPNATIKYTYGDETGEFTGSKTLTVAADATITAYAEATGYTTSATSERAVALFPKYVIVGENTPTVIKGTTNFALSTETITVSEREYAALLLDGAQWGTNVYLQNLSLNDPIVWGIRNGNWYINTTDPQWILIRNLKANDIVVVNVDYPAADMVNATYSEKLSFGTKHAYIVEADGDVELDLRKTNAKEMNYLYGVYSYQDAKAALETAIAEAKAIETEGKEGVEALQTAISTAEGALAAEDATAESMINAIKPLADAVAAFNEANTPAFDPTTLIANAEFNPEADPLGWDKVTSAQFFDLGMGLIGTYQVRGEHPAATVDETHLATEYAAGLECRWSTNYAAFTQTTAELPAGSYKLTFDVENTNASTTKANYENRFNVTVGETTYTDESTEWMNGKSAWTTHTIKFTLTEASPVTISLGYGTGSNNFGVGNTPALFVSHLTLGTFDPLADAKETLTAEITAAEALVENATYVDGKEDLNTAIATAKTALNQATTAEAFATALQSLKDAEASFNKAQAIAPNAALVAGASVENPVAAPFVVNGTFEENINGWSRTGTYQNNARANNQKGDFTNYFWENWNGSAQLNKMYQVINNIPNGVYKLKIAAFVNTLANPNESQFVFANADKTFLTTGEPTFYEVYTKVENNTLEIGLEQTTATANWMGIDNISLVYFGAECTVEDAKVAAPKNDWKLAKAEAEAALAAEANANVTGDEKTALEAEIAKTEPTTVEAYEAATAALKAAAKTFTDAAASYNALVNANAMITNLTDLPYAKAEKKPEAKNATNAAAAATAANEVLAALRAYHESNAMAENVVGAVDMTSAITNPDGSNVTGWTTTGNGSIDIKNGEPWTSADGNAVHSYFDGGNWGANAWDVTFSQNVTLNAGKYQLSAILRASGDVEQYLFAGTDSVKTASIGATGGVFNRGWNISNVVFELEEDGNIEIGVRGKTSVIHNWMSFADFRLIQLEKKDTPTGINELKAADRLSGNIYNLNGQKVQKAQKGLYIVNGKKIMIK